MHIIFLIIAFGCFLLFLYINLNLLWCFVLTFCVLMICNIIGGYIIDYMQRKVLDTDCDPEKYLSTIDKQEKRFRKKENIISRLNIKRATAHILLGNFQTAREYLEGIEKSYLSEKNGSYLLYVINLIQCYYELGEMDKAENLYETDLVRLSPILKRYRQSVEILIGERYYFLQNYDLSYQHLKKLLSFDLDKRQNLGVLYRLAHMDAMKGDKDQALAKFKKITKLGNKLWIAKASQDMLVKISESSPNTLSQ